jgi:hypothetical protein
MSSLPSQIALPLLLTDAASIACAPESRTTTTPSRGAPESIVRVCVPEPAPDSGVPVSLLMGTSRQRPAEHVKVSPSELQSLSLSQLTKCV